MMSNSGRKTQLRLNLGKLVGLGLIGLAVVMVVLVGQVRLAWAHAHLKSSSVGVGAVLTKSPDTVTLVFGEESSLKETKIEVTNLAGEDVTNGDPAPKAGDLATWLVKLKANSPDDAYTVHYHTFTEDDSGVVAGAFSFKVAAKGTASVGQTLAGNDLGEREVEEAGMPASGQGGSQTLAQGVDLSWPLGLPIAFLVGGVGTLLLVQNRRRHNGSH